MASTRDSRIGFLERFAGAKAYDPEQHARQAADLLTAASDVRPYVDQQQVVAEAHAHALTAIALVLSSGTVYTGNAGQP